MVKDTLKNSLFYSRVINRGGYLIDEASYVTMNQN